MMTIENFTDRSIIQFVLAGMAVKILIGAAVGVYSSYSQFDPGNISTPVSILAIGIGLFWYIKTVNRPMTKSEILHFAVGTAAVDLVLSMAWVILVIWISDQPLTLEGVDNAVFDGSKLLLNQNDQAALFSIVVISLLMTAFLAGFFAWLMTRKLPRKEAEHQT